MAEEEQKDLQLLEKVLMRLAMADDKGLEGQLKGLLIPVIWKLNSPSNMVKKKVLECLTHINKRVKPLESIKLPVGDLFNLFKNPDTTPIMMNFCLMYFEMGFQRSDAASRAALLPAMWSGITKHTTHQQDMLKNMILNSLQGLDYPVDDTLRFEKFSFLFDPSTPSPSNAGPLPTNPNQNFLPARGATNVLFGNQNQNQNSTAISASQLTPDTVFLLDFFLQVLLLIPFPQKNRQIIQDLQANNDQLEAPPKPIPYGLSYKAYEFIMSKVGDKQELVQFKKNILTFLFKTNFFPPSSIVTHMLVAATDNDFHISSDGEGYLKRMKIDHEDKDLIQKLMTLYLGTPTADEQETVHRASMPVRARLLTFFCRSQTAANNFPDTFKVMFNSLNIPDANARFRESVTQFMHWAIKLADADKIKTMGKPILMGLMKMINDTAEVTDRDMINFRGSLIVALGMLASRAPEQFAQTIIPLTTLFDSLESFPVLQSQIVDALKSMCHAYRQASRDSLDLIEKLLSSQASKSSSGRYLAVFYANRLFPFSSVFGRIIDLFALSDTTNMTREEANRGLKPYEYQDSDIRFAPDQEYPAYAELLDKLEPKLFGSISEGKQPQFLDVNPVIYAEVISFFMTSFRVAAAKNELSLGKFFKQFATQEERRFGFFIEMLNNSLKAHTAKSTMHFNGVSALLDLFCWDPSIMAQLYLDKVDWICNFLFIGSYDARENMAKILSLLSPFLPLNAVEKVISSLTQTAVDSAAGMDKQLGAAYGLGYLLSRLARFGIKLPGKMIEEALFGLCKLADVSVNIVCGAAIQGLGLCGRYAPLPVPMGEKGVQKGAKLASSADVTKRAIVGVISHSLDSPESRLIEKAAIAFSNLALAETDTEWTTEVIEHLESVSRNKSEEVHFTVGEALSTIGAGWSAKCTVDPTLDLENDQPSKAQPAPQAMDMIFSRIIKNHLAHPLSRAGAAIWLLSLVKYSGHHTLLHAKLRVIQSVFLSFLSDNNEVIQEVAGKGLVLVYEQGGASMQEELVKNLMSTISTGKRANFKVEGETELFPEGSLGTTPTGENLSTYKELCSLASEMGQPSLVYKFLNLASHHSLWNSRKGAAFAATQIMSQSQEQLQPFLKSLVPKLYRYSFDPNPKIALSMKNIFKAVADPVKAASDFFPEILKEVLEAINSSQWRAREGSCAALADLLQGRTWSEVKDHLREIWYRCFRVLDDIKESVRKAAMVCLKSISNLTTRLCDPAHTPKEGKEAIGIALGFLMKEGLVSEVDEVKYFAIAQILKIAKVANYLLKPHVPELAFVLLEGLSSLEPATFNYLSFHSEKMGVKQEDLDEMRINANKNNPITDILDICIKQIDDKNAEELISKVIDVVRTGIGLPTRVGVGKFISSLCLFKPDQVKAHSAKLLKSLTVAVTDRNAVVRRSLATATASICALSSPKAAEPLIQKLLKLYNDPEKEENRAISGATFLELAKRAPEVLHEFYAEIVPCVFIGKNDPNEAAAKAFQETWQELSVSSVSAYLVPVLDMIDTYMGNSSWVIKKVGALALKDIAETASNLEPYADRILKMLVPSLAGRVWKGKEALLISLATVVVTFKSQLDTGGSGNENNNSSKNAVSISLGEIFDAVSKECKKNDKEYKKYALQCMIKLLEAFPGHNKCSLLLPVFEEIVDEEVDSEEETKEKTLLVFNKGLAFYSLGLCCPQEPEGQKQHGPKLFTLLVENLPKHPWNSRVEIFRGLKVIVTRLKLELVSDPPLQNLLKIIEEALTDKYSVVRLRALELLEELAAHPQEIVRINFDPNQGLLVALQTLAKENLSLKERAENVEKALLEHVVKKAKRE